MKYVFFVCLVILVFLVTVQADMLSNGGFESPAGTTNWTASSWTCEGQADRIIQAAHSGSKGVFIPTVTAGNLSFYQDVAATTGTYSFSIWVQGPLDSAMTNLILEMAWMDAQTNQLDQTIADWSHLPLDDMWHRIHVTGACHSNDLSFIRARIREAHDNGAAGSLLYLDDAELYGGIVLPDLFMVNAGFEYGTTVDPGWNGSSWSVITQGVKNSRHQWRTHSGDWATVLEGYNGGPSNATILAQNIYPETTGTWSFSIWLYKETNFVLRSSQLRMEWRDATLTNLLQTTSTNLTVSDGEWTQYQLNGTCTDTNLFELRVSLNTLYDSDTGESMYVDDARLIQEPYTNPVAMNWGYFNNLHFDPTVERVPGTNDLGPFLQINYATSTTTFYVLSEYPGPARYPEENGYAMMYIGYRPPHLTLPEDYISIYTTMTWEGSITLTNGAFHGLPTNGTKTVSVWSYDWAHPTSNGVPYGKNFKVYYSPYFETDYQGTKTGTRFLVQMDPLYTNDYTEYPQFFHTNYVDRDYSYYQMPIVPPESAFTNGGFELPVIQGSNWNATGWAGYGYAHRGAWFARSGQLGGYLPGWHTNHTIEDSAVFQNISTTGGVYTFSTWVLAESGIQPSRLEISLNWFNSSGEKVQADVRNFISIPKDESWHYVFITSTNITDTDISYVQPTIRGRFFEKTEDPARLVFDDANFYAGSDLGVQELSNPGFETGLSNGWFRGTQWYAQQTLLGNYRSIWAPRNEEWEATFDGAQTNQDFYTSYLSQNMCPGTGTYTFCIWAVRDTNFIMTDAEVRLEWYDRTFTNKVQANSYITINPPADNYWREYHITGTCTSETLYEVRATVMMAYTNSSSISSNGATTRFDDARFYRGEYQPLLLRNWGYHNSGTNDPFDELVPGTNVGTFCQIDYVHTNTTFYVLANYSSIAPTSGVDAEVGMRVAYWNQYSSVWHHVQTSMSYVGDVTIDDTTPFHGLPQSGSHTVNLYRFDWKQPLDPSGLPDTVVQSVWYSPYFRTYSNSYLYEMVWLLEEGDMTNDYPIDPQLFDVLYDNQDYIYTNAWTPDQDIDGLPDAWEVQYFPTIWVCMPDADNDTDEHNNRNEYIADSLPLNSNSYFHSRIMAYSNAMSDIRIDAPTTNSRVYDIYWHTNLSSTNAWSPCGDTLTGNPNGGDLWVPMTNKTEDIKFFRTGVSLP